VYRDLEIHHSVKYHPLADLSTSTVPDPAEGQLVYLNNSSSQGFYYYDGASWQAQSSGGGVCYTNYGKNTCASGYTAVVTGYTTAYNYMFSGVATGKIVCSSVIHDSTTINNYFAAASSSQKGTVISSEPCAICCK